MNATPSPTDRTNPEVEKAFNAANAFLNPGPNPTPWSPELGGYGLVLLGLLTVAQILAERKS